MNVSFTNFNANTPTKNRYEYIIDYISTEFDIDLEGAFYLIKQLKYDRSSVVIYASAIADFHIYDGILHVQIDGEGFWYAGNISLETAKEILKQTFDGCENFGQYVPGTCDDWEAWAI